LQKSEAEKVKKEMAAEMGYSHPQQVSKLASGVKAPDASEIIYLAKAAQMQPIKVLADFESERHPELAHVWQEVASRITPV